MSDPKLPTKDHEYKYYKPGGPRSELYGTL